MLVLIIKQSNRHCIRYLPLGTDISSNNQSSFLFFWCFQLDKQSNDRFCYPWESYIHCIRIFARMLNCSISCTVPLCNQWQIHKRGTTQTWINRLVLMISTLLFIPFSVSLPLFCVFHMHEYHHHFKCFHKWYAIYILGNLVKYFHNF